MPALLWLRGALVDLERLVDFIAQRDVRSASTAGRRIRLAADQLRAFPKIGRRLADGDERGELIVPFGSGTYVLRYRLDTATDTVIIIRVWHSRELRG